VQSKPLSRSGRRPRLCRHWDTALTRRFGDIARQEYRAVGIHRPVAAADLATEPRWGRIPGTFGEDAALAERMVRAYVAGFQHGETGWTRPAL